MLTILFAVSCIVTGILGGYMGSDFSNKSEITTAESYYIDEPVVHIGRTQSALTKDVGNIQFFGMKLSKRKGLVRDAGYIRVYKSDGDEFVIKSGKEARGRNADIANARAKAISETYSMEGANILFPKYISTGKKSARAQSTWYEVYVPVGKKITFDRHARVSRYGLAERCNCNPSEYTWTMGEDGLYSDEWSNKYKHQKKISLDNIKRLNIDGDMKVTITKGNKSQAIITGHEKDVNALESVITDETATFILDHSRYRDPSVEITLPYVGAINSTDAEVFLEGFQQDNLELMHSGREDLKAYIDIKNLKCSFNGRHTATLIGSGDTFELTIDGAKIRAAKYKTDITTITGDLRGESSVYADEKVKLNQSNQHRIKIIGDPKVEYYTNN